MELNGYVEPTGDIIREYCNRLCEEFRRMASIVDCMMALGWSVAGSPTHVVLSKDYPNLEAARTEVRDSGFSEDVVEAIVGEHLELAGAGI